MEVKCPKCSSRFNLPDTVAKPGVKLRCSVCSKVFPLQLETPETLPEQPLPKKGRLKKFQHPCFTVEYSRFFPNFKC